MNSLRLFALLTLNTILVQGFHGGLTPRRSLLSTLSNAAIFENFFLSTSSRARMHSTRFYASPQEEEAIKKMLEGVEFDGEVPEIVRLDPNAEGVDGSIFEDVETGKPSEMMVMKELLGINIFTYILGALIVLFLSLNFFLGPGWLGQTLGIEGTGTINEISDSLPDTVDLTRPEFRLDI